MSKVANPMIRVLVLIAITGFFVAIVALASAAALGGPELATHKWSWYSNWDDDRFDRDDHDRRDRDRDDAPAASTATRELTWDGSSKVEFAIPASIEFSQAPGPGSVAITGPRDIVERVKLSGGKLSLDGPVEGYVRLRVVMTAPAVTQFDLGGEDRLEISNYKQDKLSITASGSSEVTARGEAREVVLDLSGSSEADLSQVVTDSATADVSGSSEASIAPKLAAKIESSGSSEVKLTTRPERLETDRAGSGRVMFDDGSDAVDTPARAPLPVSASKT